MRSETTETRTDHIRVAAPVAELDIPICSEVMNALPDPADPDQAVLASVPFLVDELNYGDIVRLGPEDECGVRPIVEVVVASGHAHVLVATEPGEGYELVAELQRRFPAYALRLTEANDHLLSVSVHPDLDPDEVIAVMEAWLGGDVEDPEEGLAIAPPSETELGRLDWSGMKGV